MLTPGKNRLRTVMDLAKLQMSNSAAELLYTAGREARELGHSYVGSEHLILALLSGKECSAGRLLRWMGWEYSVWRSLLLCLRGKGAGHLPLVQGISPSARLILTQAGREARLLQAERVEPEHILLAVIRQRHCTAAKMLAWCGGDANVIFSGVYDSIRSRSSQKQGEIRDLKLVEQFCEDMVAQADKADPVIGRDRETEMVMEILCRKSKNNPALIGEPGVGKTAIVEGLAQRMAAGRVPDRLRGKRLMSLNLASLLAGTKYRGEFEERVRDIVQEIRRNGNVILFIDEMHTIVGAGSAEGAIDAANLLKPALGRGEIQVIGATTLEEYRKYIEKDAALDRRFRPVHVQEPTPRETEKILQGLRPGLEEHHGLSISPEAVHAAVELSCRFLTGYFLPDKAVDLLDEGASRARMRHLMSQSPELESRRQQLADRLSRAVREDRFEEAAQLRDQLQMVLRQQMTTTASLRRQVTAQDIAETVSARTGIPVGELTVSERQRMQTLEQQMRARIVGQDAAVQAVSAAIRRSRMGLRDEKRPVASMLFMGPTGVGKTELCKVLAEVVYGTADALICLDMSEYMEQHTVSRLLGAPPGYVGHGEGGLLTEKVRRRPYCVVLLDEIEKAHRDISGILLQIMDEGVLTDSMGRKADFRNAIAIMTSNLGSGEGGALGFENVKQAGREAACLKERFSPEFLGRIDCVASFRKLERQDMEKIAALQLAQLCARTEKQGLGLSVDDAVAARLAGLCNASGGARQLRRLIRERIEDPLADLLLERGEMKSAKVTVKEETITVQ